MEERPVLARDCNGAFLAAMKHWLRDDLQCANHNTGKLLLIGLAGALVYNWRQWQRDKALLALKVCPTKLAAFEDWPEIPHVSVLVAAWNEARNIQAHINSFLNLRYPNKQMVLVAGGEDGTFDLAIQYAGPNIIVLQQQVGEGKQHSLQRAFMQASGSILYLTDADCLLDNRSFEACLHPLIFEGEKACNGISQPSKVQLREPFIVSQAASQIYAALHLPAYAPGILGRNCALRRDALERSGCFEAFASTGTDYVLAKQLNRIGVRIRQNPHSCIVTEFPTSVHDYLQQQDRWILNVLEHGWRYGAINEVKVSLFNSLVGLLMLGLPAAALVFGRVCLAIWGALFFNAWLSRLRYWKVFSVFQSRQNPFALVFQPIYLLIDFAAWALPILELLPFRRRRNW